jgi:hyperosmotically inducible protein
MTTKIRLSLLCGFLFFAMGTSVSMSPQDALNTVAADNTKVNKRDRQKKELTADQQKDNRSDLQVTKQIRQSIMRDKSLSTSAHNVKLISNNRMVTLKGPVRTNEEKQAIEAKAAAIAGQDKLTSELQVTQKK